MGYRRFRRPLPLVARRSWLVARGSRFVARSSRAVARRPGLETWCSRRGYSRLVVRDGEMLIVLISQYCTILYNTYLPTYLHTYVLTYSLPHRDTKQILFLL